MSLGQGVRCHDTLRRGGAEEVEEEGEEARGGLILK
jgi:hypothetical protein